ncbi:hypothetical protein PHLCEN_2v5233 [Hermanssonia centrifuga]|uniref:Carbonic anhydrase n=1 Tax=Hermanssonia centrifuga TaxID=98765 RepID=A0A2R6P8P6_9APHY|nr:hypothetical protein PHLCEN_2v5233 [Hermanssonia centrifuga]
MSLSSIEYVIVAGHTNCGGVAITLPNLDDQTKMQCFSPSETSSWPPEEPIATWLGPLRELAIGGGYPTLAALTTANVQQQVSNISQLEVVKAAISNAETRMTGVRGWIFDLNSRLVNPLA